MPAIENQYAAAAVKHRARCPQCNQALAPDAEARWRPFCSERCQLADLGQWFAGRYSIPADDDPGPSPDPRGEEPRQ